MEKIKEESVIDTFSKSFDLFSEEGKAKTLQLFKRIIFSDDPKANEFMKALDKATTYISKDMTEKKTPIKESKPSWREISRIAGEGVEAYVVYGTLEMITNGQDAQVAFEVACDNENLYGKRPDIVTYRKTAADILRKNFGYVVNPFYASKRENMKNKKKVFKVEEEVNIGDYILEPGDQFMMVDEEEEFYDSPEIPYEEDEMLVDPAFDRPVDYYSNMNDEDDFEECDMPWKK